MNQSQTIDLQVKVSLPVKELHDTVIKRIQTVQTYAELVNACKAVCEKSGVQEIKNLKVHYLDSDNDKIEVSDDMELQMAYATALSTDCKVKFHIELGSYKFNPVAAESKPEEFAEKVQEVSVPEVQKQAEPEVVKSEEKVPEMLPEHVATQMQQPVIEADLDLYNDNLVEDDVENPRHGKGKKGKGKKGKGKKDGAGMPRKAIKNLIRAELENAVPGIFDKLVKEAEQEQQEPIPQEEESKDQPINHIGIECDGCGMNPIVGIRYKCAVRKDFDYCANCEATKPSNYPFLKIRKAGGAPSMIITVLNEDKEGKPLGEGQQPDWSQMKEAWKTAKQQWKENSGKCGWDNKKEWTKEDCENKQKFWKSMVGGFLDKMGIDKDLAKEQWKQAKSDWKEQHGGHCHGWRNHCGGKDGYKVKRAEIVSNPDVVLECMPGCVVLHDIEVRNNTHWGWKQGCFLALDNTVEQSDLPFEVINIPVDQKVESMSNLKMTVPITVLEKAVASNEVKEYKLRFRGPKGGEIGEAISFKLKIVSGNKQADQEEQPKKTIAQEPEPVKKSHLELVKLAVKLFDTEKLGQTFNECLEVVTLVNGDEEVAKKSLQPRQ